MINDFKDSPFEKEDLLSLLEEVNNSFRPPLKERVLKKSDVSSLDQYVNKVLRHGIVLISHNQAELEGILFFYANDFQNHKAFIPLVAVREKFHRRGVGKKLMLESVRRISGTEMKTIQIRTWQSNEAALNLYERLGFEKEKTTDDFVELKFSIKDH